MVQEKTVFKDHFGKNLSRLKNKRLFLLDMDGNGLQRGQALR